MVYTVRNLPLKGPEHTWIGCIAFCYVMASILNITVLIAIESSSKWDAHEKISNVDVSPDWYDPCYQTAKINCPRSQREMRFLEVKYTMEYKEIAYESENVAVAITQQLYYFLDVYPEDVYVNMDIITEVVMTNNVVRQVGEVEMSIKFFKPYIWGRLSPQMALNRLMKDLQTSGTKFFEPYVPYVTPVIGERQFDDDFEVKGYKTMQEKNGNPYEDGKNYGPIISGGDDGRPPSRNHADYAAYILYWSAGIQFIVAYFMSKWGWENQCEHLGDIRLSTKKGDGDNFRQEWPFYIILLLTIFRIEILPETIEVMKCKQEFYGFSLLMTTNVIFQAIPFLILEFYLGFASGLGFGQTFLFMSIFCNLCCVAAFGFLWERNQAWVVKRITIDLSTAENFSVHTRVVPLIGLYRVFEILARLFPIVITMIVYGEEVVFYILALDAGVIFVLMFYTLFLNGWYLGGDRFKCTCTSVFAFFSRYLFGIVFLVFFYFDTLLGRTRHNGFVSPTLYYCARLGELLAMTYSWGLFEVGLPKGPVDAHGTVIVTEDKTPDGVRMAGGLKEPILPGMAEYSQHVKRYQSSALGDLIVLAYFCNIMMILLMIKSFHTMRKYYDTPEHELHGCCPCYCYTTEVKKYIIKPTGDGDEKIISTEYVKEEINEEEETEEERALRLEQEKLDALNSGADDALNAALAELDDSSEEDESKEKDEDEDDIYGGFDDSDEDETDIVSSDDVDEDVK